MIGSLRSTGCVLAASLLLATPSVAAPADTFRPCRPVVVEGKRNDVGRHHMSCRTARRLGRQLVRGQPLLAGWTSANPAGCENIVFRRRNRAAVRRFLDGGPLAKRVPVTFVIDNVDCES